MDVLRHCTKAVRAADEQFEREGGSSRHWVRDCFLPALEAEGFVIRPADTPGAVEECDRLREALAKAETRIAAATAEGYADGLHDGRQQAGGQ